MRRIQALVLLAVLLVVTSAAAEVTVEMLDPKSKTIRVSYSITDLDVGVSELIFPPKGFDFAAGPVKTLSAYNRDTMELLAVEPYTVKGTQIPTAVRVDYGHTIQPGEDLKVRFTVEIPSSGFHTDSDGRWILDYTTSHVLRFVVPRGHQLVSANKAIRIEEDGRRIVAVFDPELHDRRAVDFRFKTRPIE